MLLQHPRLCYCRSPLFRSKFTRQRQCHSGRPSFSTRRDSKSLKIRKAGTEAIYLKRLRCHKICAHLDHLGILVPRLVSDHFHSDDVPRLDIGHRILEEVVEAPASGKGSIKSYIGALSKVTNILK
jgi:hypothetical protein